MSQPDLIRRKSDGDANSSPPRVYGMRTLMCLLIALDARPVMRLEEFAELRGKSVRTIQNEISAGKCPVPMWKDGGTHLCHVHDVATWMDNERAAAIRADPSLSGLYDKRK